MLDALKGQLCSELCQHNIWTPSEGSRQLTSCIYLWGAGGHTKCSWLNNAQYVVLFWSYFDYVMSHKKDTRLSLCIHTFQSGGMRLASPHRYRSFYLSFTCLLCSLVPRLSPLMRAWEEGYLLHVSDCFVFAFMQQSPSPQPKWQGGERRGKK